MFRGSTGTEGNNPVQLSDLSASISLAHTYKSSLSGLHPSIAKRVGVGLAMGLEPNPEGMQTKPCHGVIKNPLPVPCQTK